MLIAERKTPEPLPDVLAALIKRAGARNDGGQASNKKIAATAENFLKIFEMDKHFENVRYNSEGAAESGNIQRGES